MMNTKCRPWAATPLVGAALLAVLSATLVTRAGAMDLIPSFGLTKSTDVNAGNASGFGGLALRMPMLPFLKAEAGIGYRQDEISGGDLTVRQWPVTASAWVSPLPMFYAGGGLGWYRTTYDYSSALPYKDSTSLQTGIHLGGGVTVPLGPSMGLDFNGRYIFMQSDNNNVQFPTTFDPNYWSTTLGLVIRL
jgi:hypothetical protein